MCEVRELCLAGPGVVAAGSVHSRMTSGLWRDWSMLRVDSAGFCVGCQELPELQPCFLELLHLVVMKTSCRHSELKDASLKTELRDLREILKSKGHRTRHWFILPFHNL